MGIFYLDSVNKAKEKEFLLQLKLDTTPCEATTCISSKPHSMVIDQNIHKLPNQYHVYVDDLLVELMTLMYQLMKKAVAMDIFNIHF